MFTGDSIATYTGFNRLALKKRLIPYLRAWYWLKHEDANGSGWIRLVKAKELLTILYGSSRVNQVLKQGNGSWWQVDKDVLYLRGIAKIVEYLGRMPGERVLIPANAFYELGVFKAIIYSTYFTRNARTLSRKTIEELFGVSKRTQIRYEASAKINVSKQIAYCEITENSMQKVPLAERLGDGEKRGVWLEDMDGDGKQELVWQISNQYQSSIPIFDKNVNHQVSRNGGSDQCDGAAPVKKQRIYFSDIRKVARLFNSHSLPNGGVYNYEKKDKKRRRLYGYIESLNK